MAHARTLTVESTRFGWIIREDDLNKPTATALCDDGLRNGNCREQTEKSRSVVNCATPRARARPDCRDGAGREDPSFLHAGANGSRKEDAKPHSETTRLDRTIAARSFGQSAARNLGRP